MEFLKKNHFLNRSQLKKNKSVFYKVINSLALASDESSDSAIHTVYERIKGIKGYKMP